MPPDLIQVVMTIRVYAIYDKSRRVLYLLLSTMVITIAIGCVRERLAALAVILTHN